MIYFFKELKFKQFQLRFITVTSTLTSSEPNVINNGIIVLRNETSNNNYSFSVIRNRFIERNFQNSENEIRLLDRIGTENVLDSNIIRQNFN
jgi:hypothetical protein